jgi:hypothetical protein
MAERDLWVKIGGRFRRYGVTYSESTAEGTVDDYDEVDRLELQPEMELSVQILKNEAGELMICFSDCTITGPIFKKEYLDRALEWLKGKV